VKSEKETVRVSSQQSHYAVAACLVSSTVDPYLILFNGCYGYGVFGFYQYSTDG